MPQAGTTGQGHERERDLLLDGAIPKATEAGPSSTSVQPRGRPINHSTHVGFRRPPPACTVSGCLASSLPGVRPGCSASIAFGVAQSVRLTTSDGMSAPPFVCPVLGPWSSRAQGVGQGSRSCGERRSEPASEPAFASDAIGVGQSPRAAIISNPGRTAASGDFDLLLRVGESAAVGVGNIRAIVASPSPLSLLAPFRL